MKGFPLIRPLVVVVTAILIHLPVTAGACSVCMGDVNSRTAPAINDAIFLMLGCIGFTLLSLAGFAVYLMKRASAAATAPDSDHPNDDVS